jgi:adenylate kinase family enzyme
VKSFWRDPLPNATVGSSCARPTYDSGARALLGVRRVVVIGSGGAGKSTLASRLGTYLRLPVVHLDKFYWMPGWVPPDPADWDRRLSQLLAGPQWIMDGNYCASLSRRLRAADAVVFLDFPRLPCVLGALRRSVSTFGTTRPEMAAGCEERVSWRFMRWVWRFPTETRPAVVQVLSETLNPLEVVVLRSRREVQSFLNALGQVGRPTNTRAMLSGFAAEASRRRR